VGDIFELDHAFEDEFAIKCEEIAMYQPFVRYTLDGEWTAEELVEDVQDECMKSREWEKYTSRAMHNPLLLNTTQLAEKIIKDNDLIDRYNEAVAKYNSNIDRSKVFNIVKFDNWLHEEIIKVLKDNLVTGGN
jgi:hypothetical protein